MRYHRIRDLREDHDLTQTQVAVEIGIGQRSYAYYESGARMLPPEILIKLARFYNVSTDYLLGLTDCKQAYPPSHSL